MKVTFTLKERPFSINAMYTSRNVKTGPARLWTSHIVEALKKEEEKLSHLRENFDPATMYYSIYLTFYYPKEKLYTKKGDLSSKAFDTTNVEKPLVDIIFGSKYYGDAPYECRNLNIDDRYLKRCVSEKEASEDGEHRIEVTIEILPLKTHKVQPGKLQLV